MPQSLSDTLLLVTWLAVVGTFTTLFPMLLLNNLNTPPAGRDEFAWPWEKRNFHTGRVLEESRLGARLRRLFRWCHRTSNS